MKVSPSFHAVRDGRDRAYQSTGVLLDGKDGNRHRSQVEANLLRRRGVGSIANKCRSFGIDISFYIVRDLAARIVARQGHSVLERAIGWNTEACAV